MTHESPELTQLFTTYTAGPDSIGRHLAEATGRATQEFPLLVATGTDLALYRGTGQPPEILAFRLSSRGFKELAAVSHLGPALATLIALRNAEPDGTWRHDAERLAAACRTARAGNSTRMWQDVIAVEAYRGRERPIAQMVDYALDITVDFLERALANPDRLNFDTLRNAYLEDNPQLPVSFNRVMIATFYLVGMDIASRLIGWLDRRDFDWAPAMVLITGKQGRPTAGVTWRTNSVARMILAAARGKLALDRVYIAPHAPTFATPQAGDLSEVAALEREFRALWAGTRAVLELGADMFAGFPAFSPGSGAAVTVEPGSRTVSEMPAIAGPGDWFSMTTRLRLVMEDPRQLLSGAVSDVAADDLIAHNNDPALVTVPGLDGEPYPEER